MIKNEKDNMKVLMINAAEEQRIAQIRHWNWLLRKIKAEGIDSELCLSQRR
jgi:hypothetical protein